MTRPADGAAFAFEITARCPRTRARTGRFHTPMAWWEPLGSCPSAPPPR
ncbi:hypothetical protein [Cyanobium sp. ATX-6F1]